MKIAYSSAWNGFLLGLFLAPMALAKPVGEREAVAVAELWYSMEINAPTTELSPTVKEQRLANRGKHQVQHLVGRDDLQAVPKTGISSLAYVVTFEPTGFVIVSGEDGMQPVLAFNVTGEFTWAGPEKNYASHFLGRCVAGAATQLRALAGKGQPQPVHTNWTRLRQQLQSPSSAAEFPSPKGPMSIYVLWPTASWGQSDHYNETCVAHNGNNNVPTGCTATAMAIQMRFHKWPPSGSGSHAYDDDSGSVQYDHSVNFGSHSYNWSAMPANSLMVDNADVADLMYDCGVAVEMDYELDGSGAWPSAGAPDSYFGYWGTYEQNWSTPTGHLAGIAFSVRCGLPVILSSSSHTMVACGYRDTATPYLYLNIGWDGASDGWYDLDGLAGGDSTIDRSYPCSTPWHYVYVDGNDKNGEAGSPKFPFETIEQGVAAVPAGGHLWLRGWAAPHTYTGSGNAPITISKPMTLHAYYQGSATIGP